MNDNKKGISAVVATVLIILITVAAVTIIWAAIIPMINDQLNRATVCLDAETALSIENKGYTCYNNETDVRVQVGHGAKDIGLVGIQVLVSDVTGDTNSTIVTVNLPAPNGVKVLVVNHSTSDPTSVAIAPMVKVGGQTETCGASSAVDIKTC